MPSTARTARARTRRLAIAVLISALAALVWAGRPPAAAAGGPGTWTDLSGDTGTILTVPALARDATGVLHVVWTKDVPGGDDLLQRSVTAGGSAGASVVLANGWVSLGNPAAAFGDAGGGTRLLVLADGMQSVVGGGVRDGINCWSSVDNGGSFTLQPDVACDTTSSAGADVQAVIAATGIFQTWYNPNVYVHRGLVPSAVYGVNDVGSYGYNPSFAYDATSGRLLVLAAYNATGKEGLWARDINLASGDAAAPSFYLDKSATIRSGQRDFSVMSIPVPAVGLSGRAGIIVAYPANYPSTTTVRVWRITPGGVTTDVLASGGSNKLTAGVAADAAGRAWVVWGTIGAHPRVYARRSNVAATAWGKTVSVSGPKDTGQLWEVAASAQEGRLDVVGLFSKGGTERVYHTQVKAGLSVIVSPASIKVGRAFTAKVTVKDAGVAVAGAKVTIAGRTAHTNASGVAKVKVGARASAGKLAVRVTGSGYTKATVYVTVRR